MSTHKSVNVRNREPRVVPVRITSIVVPITTERSNVPTVISVTASKEAERRQKPIVYDLYNLFVY